MTQKSFLIILGIILSNIGFAQRNYWQQAVDYEMEIDVDVSNYQYQGQMSLRYKNQSPDDLDKVYFHLYFNAFQPGSLMDLRLTNIADPDPRMTNNIGTKENPKFQSRISILQPNEIGYQKIKKLKQDGKNVKFKIDGTILEVELNKAIKAGTESNFTMTWEAQVPLQIRRSGRNNKEGISFSMTQWYPKMAEYDFEGWHLDEYVGREFHAPFGNFDVKIKIDKDYVIGSSGVLQNPNNVKGYLANAKPKVKRGKAEWHFKAIQIHDFAWAADPDFTVEEKQVPNGPKLYFVYQKTSKNEKQWGQVQKPTIEFFQFMSKNFGAYPWETYTIVQGGDGGMEYGTVTLVTGNRPYNSLEGVIFHEAAHSWFQQLFAFNETVYEWMDEGFTSYADALYMHGYTNSKEANPHQHAYRGYQWLALSKNEEPLSTLADYYNYNQAYGISAYSKGQLLPPMLGYVIGDENLKKTFLQFYDQWKFKHPSPNDFKRVAEKVSGINLKWLFAFWSSTIKKIDYSVESIQDKTIQLKNNLDFPMPIDLLVTYKDGSKELFYIPLHGMRGDKPKEDLEVYKGIKRTILSDWGWTNPNYSFDTNKEIQSAKIDPTFRMPDINIENNIIPRTTVYE